MGGRAQTDELGWLLLALKQLGYGTEALALKQLGCGLKHTA